MKANDKDGWPIVPGARVMVDRPYTLSKRGKVEHTGDCEDAFEALREVFGEAYPRQDCPCPAAIEVVTPTDECIVLSAEPAYGYDCVVTVRDLTTHGLRHALPAQVRVMRGDTKKSTIYREMTDPSYRAVTKARRRAKKEKA